MEDYKFSISPDRVIHSKWNVKAVPEEPKLLGIEIIDDLKFFRLGENEEFAENIINVVENRSVEDSLLEIDNTIESEIYPDPNDLWEIEGFFDAFAYIAFSDQYPLELRLVAVRVIAVLTIFDQENGCIFESEEFLKALASMYDLRNAPILLHVNNILFNLLRDAEISSNVTEGLFDIGFLPHLHSLMVSSVGKKPFTILLSTLGEFASVFLPCVTSYNEDASNEDKVDTGVLSPFVPLLAMQMRSNGPGQESAARLLVMFMDDAVLAQAVIESPLMVNLGAFFKENGTGEGFSNALLVYNAAVEASAPADAVDRDLLVNLALASLTDPDTESGPAARFLDDVVKNGEWFLLMGDRLEGLAENAIGGPVQVRRRVAFLLARALSEAYEMGERPRWRHSALRLVLDTLPAFGAGRLRVVLTAIEEWAAMDTGAVSAAGADTDIVDTLEEILEAEDEDVAAMAERLLENEIF